MKVKIYKIALFTLCIGLLGAISCKKQIDNQIPSNGGNEDAIFNTIEGFEEATLGMYHQMVHAEGYIGGSDGFVSWISSMDLLADNLVSEQDGRGSQRYYSNYLYLPSDNITTMEEGYAVIRAANLIIKNKDNIEGTDNYYGEALAVRAMVHFDLLRLYSKPLTGSQAAPNALGIPYVTSTELSLKPDRGTVQQTYDSIVSDLNNAIGLINDDNGSGRLNKAAVYGLLSRVYLYGGEWQKCIDASTSCLDVNGDPGSLTDFPNIWTDATDKGVLFKVKFTPQDNGTDGTIMIGVAYFQSTPNGIKSEWVCPKSLFDLYDSNDVRKSSYILTTSFGGVDYNAVIKYASKDDPSVPLGIVDVKYLRVAEVLLNRAEAYTMMGNDAGALADLNVLRENRYTDYTDGSETGQNLKDAIALQRRLELAFESDRWFDLKRKGLPVERSNDGDHADGTGQAPSVLSLPADDHRWELPIAEYDRNGNPNLQQNPGYPQ